MRPMRERVRQPRPGRNKKREGENANVADENPPKKNKAEELKSKNYNIKYFLAYPSRLLFYFMF